MMKKVIIALFLTFGSTAAFAQAADSLSFDENNKYIYYQVAAGVSANTDTLYNRALYFLKTAYPADQLKFDRQDKAKATLNGKGGFMIQKKALVSHHPDAKIKYNITIEVKEGKYRYWLTDFVVVPYHRDRYANFVPVSGKDVPLENGYRKLGQKDTDAYLDKLLMNCRWVSDRLKSFMSRPAQAPPDTKPKKVVTKDW